MRTKKERGFTVVKARQQETLQRLVLSIDGHYESDKLARDTADKQCHGAEVAMRHAHAQVARAEEVVFINFHPLASSMKCSCCFDFGNHRVFQSGRRKMNRQARHFILATALVMGQPVGLQAEDKLNLGLASSGDGIVYQFQLRVVQAGNGMDGVVGSRTGGGGGFSALFGDAPVRLRVRMDGDSFDGKDRNGRVTTAGLGAEGELFLPSSGWVVPFLSCGAAFQHWEVTLGNQVPTGSSTSNRVAGRAELGLKLGRRTLVSLGVLFGKTGDGRSTTNAYLALTI